jgi:hypothetical protein
MELKESKKFNSNQIISGNKSVNKLSSKGPGCKQGSQYENNRIACLGTNSRIAESQA